MAPLLHLRHALRSLARRPGSALLAALTIGVALGASVTIFSVLERVLLQPPPFAQPDRLMALFEESNEPGWHHAQVAAANFLDWRERSESFTDMAAYYDWTEERGLIADGEPVLVRCNQVTGTYFEVLGVTPLFGATFEESQTWEGGEPSVVLAYGFWQSQLGGDPAVVGKTIVLDDVAHTVLGIMPRDFEYPFADVDAWLPSAWPRAAVGQVAFRRAHGLRVVGRLSPSATPEIAEAELRSIAKQLEGQYPETNEGMSVALQPLQQWMVGDQRRPLAILSAAVALVLLVACANVANLLLARAIGRRQELAVHQALGASRGVLLIQQLVQSVLVAAAGGALAPLLGTLFLPLLISLRPAGLSRLDLDGIALDPTVLAFTLGLTLFVGLLSGLLPALVGTRSTSAHYLRPGARGATSTRRGNRTAAVLVAVEVALTLPLLAGTGLMLRSLIALRHVDPGFDSTNTLVAHVVLPSSRYADPATVSTFYRQAIEQIAAVPGVEDVALSSRLPFGNQRWSSDFSIEGGLHGGQDVRHDEVSPGLFSTLRTPLLTGRDFTEADGLLSRPVVVINRALAERYFPGEDPVGHRVCFDGTPNERSVWRTIIGVVDNVRRETLARDEQPSFYAPIFQDTTRGAHLLVRTEGDPLRWQAALRQRVAQLDPALPVADVTTLDATVAGSLARERFVLLLLGAFALLALLLAAVGIYGVVTQAVALRRREVGIRLAVGATRRQVFRLVLARSMAPVAVGLLVGVAMALALTRALSSLLYGIDARDPATFVAVVLLALGTALLASSAPTHLAARTDPVRALRSE